METIFITTSNSATKKSNEFLCKFIDKLGLKNPNKTMALANLSMYYTWKNIKSSYNNNKFEISAPTWNEKFDLPNGSYSIAAIQDYFNYIIKKHETVEATPQVLIYVDTIKNRIVFKIKSGYKLELLSKETIKLLGSTTNEISSDKNGENVPKLEIVETVLVHCNLATNDYQQASKVLFSFVPNKSFGQLLNISPHSPIMLRTVNSIFDEIKVWFTDQDNSDLEIEDNVNITLVIVLNKL